MSHAPAPAVPPAPTVVTTTPNVIGLDLSLRSTGIASNLGWTHRITSEGREDATYAERADRLHMLTDDITDQIRHADLVVVEGPSYSSKGRGTWDRAGLWWLIADRLTYRFHVPLAVAAPHVRAKYATGTGNASKDKVLIAAVRRFPNYNIDNNDVADAVILAAIGAEHLGHPLADLPKTHREALTSVAWPERLVAA